MSTTDDLANAWAKIKTFIATAEEQIAAGRDKIKSLTAEPLTAHADDDTSKVEQLIADINAAADGLHAALDPDAADGAATQAAAQAN